MTVKKQTLSNCTDPKPASKCILLPSRVSLRRARDLHSQNGNYSKINPESMAHFSRPEKTPSTNRHPPPFHHKLTSKKPPPAPCFFAKPPAKQAPCPQGKILVRTKASPSGIVFCCEEVREDYVGEDLMQTHREQRRRRLATTLRTRAGQLYKQFRTLTRALVHPGVPLYVKLVCGCAVLYVVSPIQLIPNFIPIIGQLDDVLVIGLSIRLLKRSVPPTVLEECQNASRPPLVSAIPLTLPISPLS
jgi:uncharacterized membrane protein YkvA (DUF1232 family)